MDKDSTKNVLIVAISLCVVCSILVSSPAVAWRDRQNENKTLDVKRNVLIATGLKDEADAGRESVLEVFATYKEVAFDFATGAVLKKEDYLEGFDPSKYDIAEITKKPELSVDIPAAQDSGSVRQRPKQGVVYERYIDGKLDCVVLPMKGMGLWGMMYGFIALESDLSSVRGLKYYEHKETPGLGAEVDNELWRAKWPSKRLFDEAGQYDFRVIKGTVVPGAPDAASKMDGISGATITCTGVDMSLAYWMSEHGYGPYLAGLAERKAKGAQ